MSMAQDEHYTVYAGYHPYSNYGPYSAAVDDAAANMQHAKRNMMAAEQMLHDATVAEQNMKRHMAMSMSKGMMNDDDATVEEKRAEDVTHDAMMMTGDVVEKRDVPDNKVLPDNWYGHYEYVSSSSSSLLYLPRSNSISLLYDMRLMYRQPVQDVRSVHG
jgi:hypothetical protein